MAEARPSNKVGGHAYGRRHQAISNTAEEGELCLYTGHSLGRYSSHSMRYDSHQACIRCVRNAREGMVSLDINRLLKKNRIKALKFWSKVDIGAPDDCWNWHGTITLGLINLSFLGGVTGLVLLLSITLSVLLCGLVGVTWDSQGLRLLVVTSTVAILSTQTHLSLIHI